MSREYCCRFKCDIHGRCDTEIEENCAGCEFQYDCEWCIYQDECETEEESLFEGD